MIKEKSQVSGEMTGEEIKVYSSDPTVKFDKSPMQVSDILHITITCYRCCIEQILKKEIHIPETLNLDVSELIDYPPRLLISFQTLQTATEPTPPTLQVEGLEVECNFALIPVSGEEVPVGHYHLYQYVTLSFLVVQQSFMLSPDQRAGTSPITPNVRSYFKV